MSVKAKILAISIAVAVALISIIVIVGVAINYKNDEGGEENAAPYSRLNSCGLQTKARGTLTFQ